MAAGRTSRPKVTVRIPTLRPRTRAPVIIHRYLAKKASPCYRKGMESHEKKYARIWGSPIGQDCITLHVTLAKWLGERLIYLSYREHLSYPSTYHGGGDAFRKDMLRHGQALLEHGLETAADVEPAKIAMRWVTDHFQSLSH